MAHLKLLEKQEQVKLKTSRRREKIGIRVEINKIDTHTKKYTESTKPKDGSLKK
jgi:hypothetical protein